MPLQRQVYKSSCNENGGAADENDPATSPAYFAPSYYLPGPCGISHPATKSSSQPNTLTGVLDLSIPVLRVMGHLFAFLKEYKGFLSQESLRLTILS